ncbi:MAG: diacylglycerol kinase family lipid kinase [Chloroflexales bacterium]|nr:diacylglycerol kinase family lipid kinase [Chloroflexales bacterium]
MAAPALARPMIARLLVIINPAAGIARPILKPLNQVLHPAGISWEVAITHAAGDARRYATMANAAGYDAVAVYGGDGSVMEAASGLIGSTVPLVILPGGTGNVMSIELGIPSDVGAAAQLIVAPSARLRHIDLGQVGERCFALRVCTGYEADYVTGTSREAKERRGMLAYALSAIQQDPRKVRYRLTLDGQPVEVEGYSCMVANSGNFGLAGRTLHSRISISDGRLDVLVVTHLNFIAALQAQRPSHSAQQHMVRHWQVAEVTVDALTPQTVVGDGETWDDTPFTARVVPAALRVLVP